jgi:hypothetical protein
MSGTSKGYMMRYLRAFEVVGGFYRVGKLLYAETNYDCFFYGRSTANKLFWRLYWLTPNNKRNK